MRWRTGDDNAQLNVHADAHEVANGGAHSPAPSSSESFLGVRRAASGTSNGNNSATGDRFHFNDEDMDADASIEMRDAGDRVAAHVRVAVPRGRGVVVVVVEDAGADVVAGLWAGRVGHRDA